MIGFRPADVLLLPVSVEHLMGFDALEPQNLIRHIAERPRGALVTADAGIAVLALVNVLLFHAEPFCGVAIDIGSGNEPDDPAAVAADSRFLQIGVVMKEE